MSGRKSRKSQKLGSSRRNVNRSNNRDTEEKESDDGNPQTGHEEHKSEQQIDSNTITENPSDDASLQHQPDQAKTSGISQQASPSELHIQSQESKDLLTQAEAVSKKRKMGSTRKSRGFKGGEIPEEEPEQNLGVCEEIKEEHEETKKQSVEVRKSKEDNDQHVLSDYSSCQPTKPESLSLQSALTGISSHEHELLEGATFCAESTSHSTHLSVGKPTESTVPSHENHLTLSQVHQQVETLPDFTGLKGRKQGSDDSPLCENSEKTEGLSESISKVLHQHWTVDPEEQGIPLISSNAYDFLKDSQESQYAQIHSVINQSSINIMHQEIQEGEPMFSSLSSTAETKEEVPSKSFGKEHEQEYSNSSEKTVYSTRDGSEEKWQNATQTKTENDISDNWLENKKETLPEDLECINDELQSSEYMKGNEDHKDEHLVEDRNECAEKVEVKHPVQPAEPNENSTLSTIEENLEDRPFDKSLVVVCDSSSSEMQHDCSVDAVDENTEKTEESLKGHDSEEDNKTSNICPKAELLDFVTEEKITSSETMCEEVAEEINMIKQEYNLTQNSSEEISLELEMQRKEESESKQESRFYDEKSILLCDKERGCDLAENENQHYFEEIRLSKNRDNVENVVESDETLKLTMTNANVPESTDIQRTEKITLSAYDRQEGVSEERVHAAEALTTDHITGPAEIISLSLSEQPQTEAACNEEDIRYKYKEEEEGVVQLVSTLAKEDGAVKDYSGQTGQKKYRTVSPTYSGECEEYNIPHLSEEQFKAVEVTTEPVTNSTIDLTEDECKTSSCFTQEKWLGSCDTLTERREQGLEDGIENDVAIKCKNISQEDDETLTTVFVCAENEGKVQDCSAKPECDVFDSEVMTNTPVMISNVLVHQTECVIHNEETKAKVLVEKEKHKKTPLDDEKSNDSTASNDQKIPQIQNDAGTFIDSSQEMSIVVEEYDKENASQVHTSLTSGTMKDIPETQDNVDIPGNAENIQEMAHDQTAQLPWHYNRSEDHLEKSESQSRQEDNVISETPELSTSGKRRKIGSTRFSHRGQLHGGDKKKINEKEENQDDKHLTEEGIQPKEETNTCPKEDSSTEDLTAVCSEHVLSEVSSLTAKLSLHTNILPSPVTEPGDSKTDDGNDHENVEIKITELHPQSQSKKKKRFGSTRKPQGGHRPDHEEEERQLKHTETMFSRILSS
ncbi:uncharacterized protein LOC125802246 [Astyanax mexicanus]|uniref:uncharacterized protein LOC125802246 n=1 Tax=Astyanax mexicanus TaxID=7994 RepID=UPI0020CB4F01|nr:uncharacterized protein LOC125802246 [Astyanax mexicanus]